MTHPIEPEAVEALLGLLMEDAQAISGLGKRLTAANIRQAAATIRTLLSRLEEGWLPIESAPRDGVVIDVWRAEGGRDTVYWGRPPHDCGEMGPYCDSDWHHSDKAGWICSTFGEFVGGKHNPFTHWRALPVPPSTVNKDQPA